jgi:hypothetical protein
MSRSKKKTPVSGITNAATDQADKRHANRVLRRASEGGNVFRCCGKYRMCGIFQKMANAGLMLSNIQS